MEKPKNYDNVQAYGEFKPLPKGGYVCVIKNVKETESRNGKPMLEISLDIAEGAEKGYFSRLWKSDTRKEKRWGCIVYQLVNDRAGEPKPLKTFHKAVEESNKNFSVVWGDKYADCFKDKLIGGIFGREEYRKTDGNKAMATKCFFFRSAEAVRNNDFDIPEDRMLEKDESKEVTEGYTIENVTDNDNLPF